ncbi:hypothetical protein P171DRAFT_478705 [Karstenula rhodostoma CBS 690.94]|uniref:Uncharacterized protein n=1 Tax=Karstenula rhodostoma CBS 690.94 TaxID=1392251 RepID=A0A9P4UJT8_9PLEO|nr:hypothetical protein P171DRAFT_478705 [Karstenula rhodostoma CBS 690.94]
MERALAAEHARTMEHLNRTKSQSSSRAGTPTPMPMSVMGRNPSGSDFWLDTAENGSSTQTRVTRNLKAYVADEEEELAREDRQDACIADETVSPSEEAVHVPWAAKSERVPTPFGIARPVHTNGKPERIPTPFPFATGQYSKSQGKKPINSSPAVGNAKFNTSPARLERISSSSPLQLVFDPSPPRPSSIQEGKGMEKASILPSSQEMDSWRPGSTDSTASSLHPGFRTRLAPRYSPLHRTTKHRQLPNIDSVISPCPMPSQGIEDVFALRYGDFFATPVGVRSPIDKDGIGIASPMSSERFYELPEYTGDSASSTDSMSPRRMPKRPGLFSSSASTVSEGRAVLSPSVSEAGARAGVELDFEMEEEVWYPEWLKEVEKERGIGVGFVGRVKGLFRKMRGREGGGNTVSGIMEVSSHFTLMMSSESTFTTGFASASTPFATKASKSAENATASFAVNTTLVTSLVTPTKTALHSHVTTTTPIHAAGPIAISQDDIPQGWIPDLQRADTIKLHTELVLSLGVLGLGIVAVWLWSLCGCWWRGECFWHCDQGTCWGVRKKWRRTKIKRKGYRQQGYPGDERWRYT